MYESNIKEEILYFNLDLSYKHLILGNNDFIAIYFYGNIFKEGVKFIISKNINLNVNYILLYSSLLRKIVLSY